ncbi:molybdopterin-dependent oxidoreductase [Maliponia aquimaris]|nr:molybdopterin-dependent oxidoreductase [Maliponia aquimaris]
MLNIVILSAIALGLGPHVTVLAGELPQPQGTVLLTVTGDITNTNGDGAARLDIDMLRAIGETSFETDTIWTAEPATYTGVELDDLLAYVGATGSQVDARAINDYAVVVPASDGVDGGPVVAYEMNGQPMSRRDKGPLWLIYPYASSSSYRTEVIYARSIWQLDRMHVHD